MASYSENVIAIGTLGLEERQRTSLKTGKVSSRYTVTVHPDPVIAILDEVALGKGPAEAIKKIISERISAISVKASPGTLKRREVARRAFESGSASGDLKRRYKGLRGSGEAVNLPGEYDTLFNDSGKLAAGIHVQPKRETRSWTINVPAGRLDPIDWRDRGAYERQMDRLMTLVPELGSYEALSRHAAFQTAIAASANQLVTKLRQERSDLIFGAVSEYGKLIKSFAQLGRAITL